jgi:hypothetical protein
MAELFLLLLVYSAISVVATIAAVVSLLLSDCDLREKLLWLLVIIFVPLGWLIYFILK